jgi:hypothetical protein
MKKNLKVMSPQAMNAVLGYEPLILTTKVMG